MHVTKNGGSSWSEIGLVLPNDLWVSRIISSSHKKSRVYLILNGYRWDDFTAYLYVSEDFGESWKSLSSGLPSESLNVVKEDPENEDILYVGSDHGVYISTDKGNSFMMLGNLPYVPVHDIVIHPRDGEMVIGTHGRSIYKTDIKPLRKLVNSGIEETKLFVFDIDKMRSNPNWGRIFASYMDPFEPELEITVFSKIGGTAKLQIKMGEEMILTEKDIDLKKGISSFTYDLSIDATHKDDYQSKLAENAKEEITIKPGDTGKIYLLSGEYDVVISQNDVVSTAKLVIE